jgi:hypothetical protein
MKIQLLTLIFLGVLFAAEPPVSGSGEPTPKKLLAYDNSWSVFDSVLNIRELTFGCWRDSVRDGDTLVIFPPPAIPGERLAEMKPRYRPIWYVALTVPIPINGKHRTITLVFPVSDTGPADTVRVEP